MQRQPLIYQWHGIHIPEALAEECASVIDKLVNGPRDGLKFKYLRGYDEIITVRLNKKRRLLLTTVEINGDRFLVVCGVLDNHKHAEHSMMQKGVLENFRKRHAERLNLQETDGLIPEERFVKIDYKDLKIPALLNTEKKSAPVIKKTVYFNKTKFIELNDEQSQVAEQRVRFPAVVLGDAGSGKSCIVSAFLVNYAKDYLADDDKFAMLSGDDALPVLCVAKSARVRAFLQHNWKLSPISNRYTSGQVVFKDYESLIRELIPELSQFKKVGEAEFNDYFKHRLASKIKNAKTTKKNPLSTELLSQQENVYREFRIISGCKTLERYKELGKKQSLFRKECDMEWLYLEYLDYLIYLSERRFIDFAFYELLLEEKYQRVIVDEAPDFSWCELENLFRLARNKEICYCVDEKQSLNDPLSKLSYLQWLLDAKAGKMQIIRLTTTYRCGTAIMEVANAVASLGDHFALDQKDKFYGKSAARQAGYVEIVTDLSTEKRNEISETASAALFAVITTCEYLEEAKAIFKDEIVLTVEEAKGLEFDVVLAYRMMDSKTFYAANDEINQKCASKVHYVVAFNAVYTACTRAVSHLIIYEKEQHKLRHLLEKMRKAVVSDDNHNQTKVTRSAEENADRLFGQFKQMIIEGRTKEQVSLIGKNKLLNFTDEDIDKYIAEFSIKQEEPVIAPVPVEPKPSATTKKKNKKKKQAATPGLFAQPNIAVSAEKEIVKVSKTELEGLIVREHLTREHIAFLFGKKNTPHLLFNVPLLKTGECLFTLLLDRGDVRSVVINDYLINNFDEFAPHMTPSVLNRKNDKDETYQSKMPPIFWMTFYLKFTRRLVDSKHVASFLKKVSHRALTATLSGENAAFDGYSVLYFLSCAAPHTMVPIAELLKNKFSFSMVTPEKFYQRSPNIYSPEWQSSIFDNLLYASDESRMCLLNVMRKESHLVENFSLRDAFAHPLGLDEKLSSLCHLRKNRFAKEVLELVSKDSRKMELGLLQAFSEDEVTRLNKVITPDMLDVCQNIVYVENAMKQFALSHDTEKLIGGIREGLSNSKTVQSMAASLFRVPVQHADPVLSGECWFFQLMSDHATTRAMKILILEKPQLFGFMMTAAALCGSKVMPEDRVTPWVLMMFEEPLQLILVKWLESNRLLAKTIPLWALFASIKEEGLEFGRSSEPDLESEDKDLLKLIDPGAYTVFQLFSMYPLGRDVIRRVMQDKCRLARYFTPEFFMKNYLETPNKKYQVNLLQWYLPDELARHHVIDMLHVLVEAEVMASKFGVTSTFATIKHYIIDTAFERKDGSEIILHDRSDIDHEPMITYLLTTDRGLEILIWFVLKASDVYNHKLIKLLFAPFVAETPDTSRWVTELKGFYDLIAEVENSAVNNKPDEIHSRFENTLQILLNLLQKQPSIKLDQAFCLGSDQCDAEKYKNKIAFANSMCGSAIGRKIHAKICRIAISQNSAQPGEQATKSLQNRRRK